MIKLIKDVLSFSQLSIERPPLVKQDLNELVRSALGDFDLLIEQKNAVVTVDPLPVVLGIPAQLHQLFGNLLSNALKFTSSETQPRVRVSYIPSQQVEIQGNPALLTGYQYAHIMVTDNGIGFDRVHSKQIFQIFQRLHTKNKYAGTGIGLAMCKKIAENHHGDIFAEPNERQGSTFHVLLPVNETTSAKNGY